MGARSSMLFCKASPPIYSGFASDHAGYHECAMTLAIAPPWLIMFSVADSSSALAVLSSRTLLFHSTMAAMKKAMKAPAAMKAMKRAMKKAAAPAAAPAMKKAMKAMKAKK